MKSLIYVGVVIVGLILVLISSIIDNDLLSMFGFGFQIGAFVCQGIDLTILIYNRGKYK